MKVRCADNDAKHLILFKAGRVMKFEDYEDKKYKSPKTSLFPEKLIMIIPIFQALLGQDVVIGN